MVETTDKVGSDKVWQVKKFVVNLLGILGNLVANWFILEKWEGDAAVGVYIGQVLAAVVINLGTLLFMGLWSLISKFDGVVELIGGVVLAVEEQAMGYESNGEKLDQAVKLVGDKVGGSGKLGWLSKIALKPLVRYLISVAAKPLKTLIYKEPPVKLKVS